MDWNPHLARDFYKDHLPHMFGRSANHHGSSKLCLFFPRATGGAAAAACCGGSTRSLSSTYSWLPHVCDRAVVFGSACLATQRRSFDFCGMWVLTRSQQVTWFLKQTLGYLGKTFRCASTVKSALQSCRKLQAAVSK